MEQETGTNRTPYDLAGEFHAAFRYFNEKLFDNSLPEVVITTQRHGTSTFGFFATDSYKARKFDPEKEGSLPPEFTVHEIAMMPDMMDDRSDEEVLSTLVHEMCHLWQHEHGTPSRSGYHNREWAAKMHQVGLHPSKYGKLDARNKTYWEKHKEEKDKICPGEGPQTGQQCSHFIIAGGLYDRQAKALLETGFKLSLQQFKKMTVVKPKSKVKFTCPKCNQNAWAKPGARIACSDCQVKMESEEEGGI